MCWEETPVQLQTLNTNSLIFQHDNRSSANRFPGLLWKNPTPHAHSTLLWDEVQQQLLMLPKETIQKV